MNAEPSKRRPIMFAAALLSFVLVLSILFSLDETKESPVQRALIEASKASSKEEKAQILLRISMQFDSSNAHEAEEIAEQVALNECKAEYVKALESYIRNDGHALSAAKQKFLRDFASSIPNSISK